MRSWILMPLGVEFLISTDGTDFQTMGLVRNELSDREAGIFCRDFAVTFAPVEARIVKVRIKNYGELPSWHPGAGNPSMFFCDEIVVE